MRGQILIKGLKENIYDITTYDVIRQLQSIIDIEFQEATVTKLDYWDLVRKLYATTISPLARIEDRALNISFDVHLSMLFESAKKDTKINEKLLELGAKPIDFAFMNGDVEIVQNLVDQLKVTNVFTIAKNMRMHKMMPTASNNINEIVLFKKSSASLPLLQFEENALQHSKVVGAPKTAIIDMFGMGGAAWDSGQTELWSEALCAQFETTLTYGNGNVVLTPNKILNACKLFQSSNIHNDLDFALVVIEMHGSKEEGELVSIIEELPKLAKNTLYSPLFG